MAQQHGKSEGHGNDGSEGRYRMQSASDYRRTSEHYHTRAPYRRGSHTAPRPKASDASGSSAQSSRRRRTAPKRAQSGKRPLVIGLVAIVAVIAVVGIVSAVHVSSQESDGAWTTPAAPLEDGRIVMQVNGDEDTYVKQGEDYIESGARAYDKKEGFLTDGIKTSGTVDTSKTGDYDVTYTVRNSENMEASTTRTVHVVDDMDVDTDGISVLMYHYVYDEGNPPAKMDANYISSAKLDAELKWLSDNDYYYPSFAELRAYLDGTHSLPKKSVILTFDDGEQGFLDYGTPLLNKYHVPATSYIIGSDPNFSEKVSTYMSPYVNFQSHTYDLHRDGNTNKGKGGKIWDLDQNSLEQDCSQAISQLHDAQSLAYPYGDCPDFAPAALEDCGYLCAFTVQNDQVRQGDNPYKLPRVRMFGSSALEGFEYQVQHGIG